MRSAIVTGANGFVGKAVVESLLSHGVEVFAVTHSEQSTEDDHVISCDMDDYSKLPSIFDNKAPDVFYHFAWQGTSGAARGDELVQLKNVEGTCSAVRAAAKIGCKRFIFASSIMEYEVDAAIKTQKIPDISDVYSTAKLTADYMARIIAADLNIEYNSALISNIYGPGERSERLINSCIYKLIKGEHISLSPCDQLYDFIYITDAAEMFWAIGDKGVPGNVYYVGNRSIRPLKEFMTELRDVVAPGSELGFGEIPFDGVSLTYDEFDKDGIYRDTGISPLISFADGIRSTRDYILKESL